MAREDLDADVVFDDERDLRYAAQDRVGPISDEQWCRIAPSEDPPHDAETLLETVERVGVDDRRLLAAREQGTPSDALLERLGKLRGRLILETDLRLRGSIDNWRQEHFGKRSPPFATIEEAGDWIEQTQFDEMSEGRTARADCHVDWLEGGSLRIKAAPKGGKLELLMDMSNWVARLLKCEPAQATNLILLGESPCLPDITAEQHWGWDPALSSFSVHVRSSQVTEDDVLDAFRRLREKTFGRRRGRPPKDEDLCLAAFALDLPGGSWDSKLEAWNERYPYYRRKKADGLRKGLDRAVERLLNSDTD